MQDSEPASDAMAVPPAFSPEAMRYEKGRVARNSVFAAVIITVLKVVVGLSTGSLGILSEAAHSALDLVAAVVTWFSVRIADRPADSTHQYGHGKVESLSAFFETALLLATCVWIIWEATRRLTGHHQVEIEPSAWAFGVMGLSIVGDAWRSRALYKMARKYESQALQADALHFSTDMGSSSVVILGLVLVVAGRRFDVPWLASADTFAALVVAAVVIYVSGRLARQTLDALLDAAPADVRSRMLAEVSKVPGVLEVDRARIRRAGNRYFADLAVALQRTVTFQRSVQVVSAVSDSVRRVLGNADVVVHAVPRARQDESLFDRIRAVAGRENLQVHDVSIQELGGRLHVEQHLELDPNLALKDAHARVTRLEAEIQREIPEICAIVTHIESEPTTIECAEEDVSDPQLEERLRAIVREFPEVVDLHDMRLKRVGDRLHVSCHCTMADDLALGRVHDTSTALETRFKKEVPELFRVLIHPEPRTDNVG